MNAGKMQTKEESLENRNELLRFNLTVDEGIFRNEKNAQRSLSSILS